MPATMTPAAALTAYLNSIPQYLQSPLWPQLLAAAGQVRGATDAAIILQLMGAAASYGMNVPTSVQFPRDHELHLDSGAEWYWLSCNLEVEGSNGLDRVAVLAAITRSRAVSLSVQQQAGWSDVECQVVDSVAIVTVATRNDSFIVRRSTNTQWPAMGGSATFGNQPFMLGCGADSYTGFMNVLPLVVQIDDGSNMTIDLEMNSDLPPENAFFLQGVGGLTPMPAPGRYYSWPQLSVKGSVAVGGKTYAVKGSGWLDHQLMMHSTTAPVAPPPPQPGWVPVQHCAGWSWCEFNLDNGDALTAAGFQIGTIKTGTAYLLRLLRPASAEWLAGHPGLGKHEARAFHSDARKPLFANGLELPACGLSWRRIGRYRIAGDALVSRRQLCGRQSRRSIGNAGECGADRPRAAERNLRPRQGAHRRRLLRMRRL